MDILYEDNHLIAVNKKPGELVQGDKTGDKPLSEKVKLFLKEKYNKPGNVFCGVIHRLDRPSTGVVLFAKTSKALTRMNRLFRDDEPEKVYWAIVKNMPEAPRGELVHYMIKDQRRNKSSAYEKEIPRSKKAVMQYKLIAESKRYYLLEVRLKTGRHHQIRCQLATIGSPIKGDLKYGAERSNRDGGISLHARTLSFVHPVSQKFVSITAPVPQDNLWREFEDIVREQER